ncbi:hypothetical protein F511_19494 [Dorcoceras hygrometricum]|uniref:Uncharacterized protein n=1 Tax=Dorcoceras hygrometricum TaxID=472368 RepID=A0A2Z7C3N4_9LAMI|nr:hypothetical protein F511_19494 [Dorcoceras hygrometricum]
MILVYGVWTVEPCADKTAFRSAQIYQNSISVVPSVQFSLDQRPSSPTTADSSSSLRFDSTDVDATASSLPPVSQDFSAALTHLQAILLEKINESQSGISSRLHKIEQVLHDSLSDKAAIFKNLSQEARQEGRTIDDPPPPPPPRAAAAVFAGKIVSGQFDEENPFVLISSGLLVQPDEGVSDLVVDRIGVNYRNLSRRAGFL